MTSDEFLIFFGDQALAGDQPFTSGERAFSADASVYAKSMFEGNFRYRSYKSYDYACNAPVYWEIIRESVVVGEIIALPSHADISMPTALEVAFIEFIRLIDEEEARQFLGGNRLIVLGEDSDTEQFGSLITSVKTPKSGSTILQGLFASVEVSSNTASSFTKVAARCFATSFDASPLKFRYIEIYRVLEARFLHNILGDINLRFLKEPGECLSQAVERLSSEIKQIVDLAKIEPEPFEKIQQKVDALSANNRFAAALKHKLGTKGKEFKSPQCAAGAAFVYYIRCAIVHAGNKDIIFESFDDGVELVENLVEDIEYAALIFSGFRLR